MISGQACQPTPLGRGTVSTDFPAGASVSDFFVRPARAASFVDETSGAEEKPGDGGSGGESLEDAARDEREYARGRVRAELGREPTEEEVDEWVREHTEGY